MSKTALVDAVRRLDLPAVQSIFAKKPALREFHSEKGFDVLQLVCSRPTAGEPAAAARQLTLAKWLVGEGFDPLVTYTTKPGEDGEEEISVLSLVFFAVARAQNNRLARYFLGLGARPEALFAAVWWGNWEILADLVRQGADLNVLVGGTPLHMAVGLLGRDLADSREESAKRRLKTLKEVIALGADLSIGDTRRGDTPLHSVLEKGYDPSIFKVLLAAGANPDLPAKNGRTVREIAARKKDKRYAQALRCADHKNRSEVAGMKNWS